MCISDARSRKGHRTAIRAITGIVSSSLFVKIEVPASGTSIGVDPRLSDPGAGRGLKGSSLFSDRLNPYKLAL